MIELKRIFLRLILGFYPVLFVSAAFGGASVKMVCPCEFEQIDQTVAKVELSLGFIDAVEASDELRLEVVHLKTKDLLSGSSYYILGEANLGAFDFGPDPIPMKALIPLRAQELGEGQLGLLLWSNDSDVPIDQVLLGSQSVAIDASYGIWSFDSPSIFFSSGLEFEFGLAGAELSIGDIRSPDLAGQEETWNLQIVVADQEGSYFPKAEFEVTVSFDADGKASLRSTIDLSHGLDSHLSDYANFTEVELLIYRNGDFYLRYWLESLAGQSGPELVPLIKAIDAISDSDGDGLTDYVESLVGSSPEAVDWLSPAEIEVAFTYGATAAEAFGDDLNARLAHVIDVANLAFETSAVPARVAMTDLIELGDDSGLTAAALIPQMEVRDELFADLDARFTRKPDLIIHLGLIDVIDTGGLANLQGGLNDGIFDGATYAARGSNVGVVGLDNSDTTLVHEVGHLMGLDHSRVQGTADGAFPWSLGHGVDAAFVTIMAYASEFSDAAEVANFSTPTLICDGADALCGVNRADLILGADAARSLAITAFQVAATSNGFTPVIQLIGGPEVTVSDAEAIAELVFTISDAEDGDLTTAAERTLAASAEEGFDYVQTIRVTDSDGNSVEAARRIKVDGSLASGGDTVGGASDEGSTDASDSGGSSDAGDDDGVGSGGGTDAGVGSDDTDGDGLPDDRDPEPDIDNSEQLAHYLWVKDRMTWLEARDYAKAQGGYLASISSQLENDLIYAIVSEGFDENSYQTLGYADDGGSATYVYIGASDRAEEGTFVWESGEAFSFKNWGKAEPDNYDGNQNVVGLALENWPYQASDSDAFGLTSQWNDISETNELTFVIEFDEAQTGGTDGGSGGGTTDSGETDGGSTDDGETDSGTTDGGGTSGGTTDSGGSDGGTDGGTTDNGSTDGDTTGGDSGFESEAGILDIDGDGKRAALSDGLLIIRHLFGFQGTSLISGAVSQSAMVTEAVDIAAIIESHRQDFDIDEDGETKPLTDGLLIIRHLFGFEGASLVAGATSANSALTAAEIAANLEALESYTDDGSGGGTTDDGEVDAGGTDNGSGTSDGGTSTTVDVLLKVTYDRVNPVTDLSNGYYQAKLDYDAIESLPGRFLSVEVIDADTDQTFDGDWMTSAEGLASGQLPVDRSFYFKIRAKSEVSDAQAKWSVSVHDNQGSINVASYPQYVAISDTFTTSADRSIEVAIKSGWTGTGYTAERAAAPFAIIDTIIDAMGYMARNSSGLEYPPLEIYWSKDNTIAKIGTSFYSGGVIYILGGVDEDTDEYDEHVIVHEWGHYLQDRLSRDDSPGGPHGSGDILDPRIAFSEGWANALSGIVLGDSDYKDTNGAEQAEGFYLPMEEGFPSNVVEVTTGWFSEDSAAEIVLDLFDANNDLEDADTVSLSITEMTSALVDEVPDTPVATTIFSLLKPLISANQEEETAIRALLRNHSIALDAGEIDVYGSYEQVVSAGVTDNALPIFTSIEVDGEAVRVCQDNKHTPEDYLSSEADANKLGNRTLGRFSVTESGSFDFSATSGIQGGLGRSDDPDLLVYKLGQQIAYNSNSGAVSESLYDLTVGEYWFVLYDYGFLAGKQSSAPCQLVEIKKK